jgi:acetyl esterase/lipase
MNAKNFMLSCFAVAAMTATAANPQVITLSPDGEAVLSVYHPEKSCGVAVVDCPGGGYQHLAIDHEGTQWAPFFNERGITYAVLKYRMPKGDRSIPMGDAQKAVKMMRDSAAVWGINPEKVGIMGFSAGGHLASTTAVHATGVSKPDFQILFYPVITMQKGMTHEGSAVNFLGADRNNQTLVDKHSNELQVNASTPQAIILLSTDDNVVTPLENGVAYYTALKKAGVTATLHVYPFGGHGWGIRDSFGSHSEMLDNLSTWLQLCILPQNK